MSAAKMTALKFRGNLRNVRYGGPVNEELWASFWERDLWEIQFWKSKGVPVLDVRALYMRMDA